MYPIAPPLAPMLAKAAKTLPGGAFLYEPKWDGFRALVFRDGADLEITSRNERSLLRYFPELVAPLLAALPPRAVVDGEIVIAGERGLDFDLLTNRIHPAESRVQRLAAETPAAYVAFDLLAESDDLRALPMRERRARLEAVVTPGPSVFVTPATTDPVLANEWFERFEGAGLDGVVAKGLGDPYRGGDRTMWKLKHERTADCVLAGYREHKDGGVGSLLLGLYDDAAVLHHVGVASSFDAARRRAFAEELAPLREGALDDHPWRDWATPEGGDGARKPGAQSRWNAGKDLGWEPLRIERVVEVQYGHLQGDRIRHTARFVRWRPDRDPQSCTYAQLDAPVPAELAALLRDR